jgi:hypothetical protein
MVVDTYLVCHNVVDIDTTARAEKLLVQDLHWTGSQGHETLCPLSLPGIPIPLNQDVNSLIVNESGQSNVIHLDLFNVMKVIHLFGNAFSPIHSAHSDFDEIFIVRRTEGENVHFNFASVIEPKNILRKEQDCLGIES